MPRPNRTVAFACIAIIALAAFLPGISALDHAWFELQWVLLPDETTVLVETGQSTSSERPLGLLSLLPSRAPPFVSLA
jgi:hypothetical protein